MKNVIYLFGLLLISCASSKNSNAVQQQLNDHWSIGVPETDEGRVSIRFTNKSEVSLRLFDPLELRVERREGEVWEKVSIRYCDCGVTCPAPPDQMSYEPGDTFNFSWDLMMEECIHGEIGMTTERTRSPEGRYRVTYRYSMPDTRQRLTLQAEFELN